MAFALIYSKMTGGTDALFRDHVSALVSDLVQQLLVIQRDGSPLPKFLTTTLDRPSVVSRESLETMTSATWEHKLGFNMYSVSVCVSCTADDTSTTLKVDFY